MFQCCRRKNLRRSRRGTSCWRRLGPPSWTASWQSPGTGKLQCGRQAQRCRTLPPSPASACTLYFNMLIFQWSPCFKCCSHLAGNFYLKQRHNFCTILSEWTQLHLVNCMDNSVCSAILKRLSYTWSFLLCYQNSYNFSVNTSIYIQGWIKYNIRVNWCVGSTRQTQTVNMRILFCALNAK